MVRASKLLATLSCLLPLAAHAANRAEATLSHIVVTVADMNAGDGVAASFVIGANTENTFAVVNSADFFTNAIDSDSRSSGDLFTPMVLTATTAGGLASASVTADGLSASGSTLRDGGHFSATAASPLFTGSRFTLSAHSRVTITAEAFVSGEMDARTRPGPYLGRDDLNVAVQLMLSGSVGDLFANDGISVIESTGWPRPAFSQQVSRVITVALTNDTADAVTGQFTIGASVSGFAAIEPVPEPATWLSLLAGGGLLAGVAWRRRR